MIIRLNNVTKVKKFASTEEFLKYHGFKHVNDHYTETIYAGYDYGDVDFHYHTFPLYKAIKYHEPDLKLIEMLLKSGADPNFYTTKSLGPVIHVILINNWNEHTINLLKLLLLYNANANIRGDDYKTPLHQAAFRWNHDQSAQIIQLLIDHGAKLNKRNSKMDTPYNTLLKSYKYDWERNNKLQMPFKLLHMLNPANDYNRE